jgi:hypothetical protein
VLEIAQIVITRDDTTLINNTQILVVLLNEFIVIPKMILKTIHPITKLMKFSDLFIVYLIFTQNVYGNPNSFPAYSVTCFHSPPKIFR